MEFQRLELQMPGYATLTQPTFGNIVIRFAMHKSRLSGFIIDCQTDDVQQAANFWEAALGMKQRQLSPEEQGRYVQLVDPHERLHIEVQAVSHASRVHLDIETDDIEAEVQRLQRYGAAVVDRIKNWVVMQAPTGQRFCVVRATGQNFADDANTWS